MKGHLPVLAVLLLLGTARQGLPAPREILLESSFDADAAGWTATSGRWYLKDGAWCETTDSGGPLWSVAGADAWTDYEIDAAMKAIDSGGSLYIAGRWRDSENYYALEYRDRGDSVAVLKCVMGTTTTLARKAGVLDIGGGKNPFGRFRFSLAGPVLTVFIGDEKILQTVDRTFRSGRAALGAKQRRGVWDSVRVERLAAPGAEEVAAVSPVLKLESPVRSFLRGDEAVLRFSLRNDGAREMRNLVLSLRLLGVYGIEKRFAALGPRSVERIDFPLDTRIVRSGAYSLKAEVSMDGVPILQRFEPVAVAPAPNPQRMEVINWTGLDAGIENHGFTAFWVGGVVGPEHADAGGALPVAATDPVSLGQTIDAYNRGVALGLVSGIMTHNISARDLENPRNIAYKSVAADGTATGGNNPNHPAFTDWAERQMEAVMRTFRGFTALKTANLNSEWDREFDYSPETVALYKKSFGGAEPPRIAFPVDRKTADPAHLPANGLIKDDNPYYRYLLWWWETGQGLVPFNERMARIVKKHRPDILTIAEPVLRCPSLYGKARGCDIAQHWSYAWPSPRSIMLSADELVAVKKFTGQMISHDVQFLWKKGWIGPDDMTPSPDVIRESLWINMSRPMDHSFVWGTYLAIQNATDPKETVNADVYEEFKRFSETVTKPFGPMVRKALPEHKPVAFLTSTASELFVKGWRWAPGIHSMNFYDALQAARIPTDVVHEADITADALKKRAYRALVLSYCQTLPEGVHRKIVEFARSGGRVYADRYLEADIPGVVRLDADFEFYRALTHAAAASGKSDVDRVKQKFEETVAGLRKSLAGAFEPEIETDSPDVLYNRMDGRGVRIHTFINDRRTAGEWAGRFKTVHDAGLPQTARISIRRMSPGSVFYDLLDGREIVPVESGRRASWFSFDCRLGPCAGRYVVEAPERIGAVRATAAAGKRKTDPVAVTVAVAGTSGRPAAGLQPVRVDILDGAGVPTEYSDWFCAENGVLKFSFRPAVNEAGGTWTVRARDLSSSATAECWVAVPNDPARFAERKVGAGGRFDAETWDRD